MDKVFEDATCIVLRFRLNELRDFGGFSTFSKHLTRTNPDDNSEGYKYACLDCSKMELVIKREEFSFYIQILKPYDDVCGPCMAMLLKLHIVEL